MEIKDRHMVSEQLKKLTIVILSKNRERELNQVINYWSRTPCFIVIVHDTKNPLNSSTLGPNITYINSQDHILDRLGLASNYIFTPYAAICNDDEIYLIDPLIRFISYLEVEKNIEAVGGQVFAYDWAGNRLLGNNIYSFLKNFSNKNEIAVDRIRTTLEIQNVMDLTLIYRSEQFKNIIDCCKHFSKFTTPFMYETMFAFFSSYYCRSIRFNDIYWMRNWFTPFQQLDKWDRKLNWSNWCSDPKFEIERSEWSKEFTELLHNKTNLSDSNIKLFIQFLFQWKATDTNKNFLKKKINWKTLKKLIKLVLPNSLIRTVKRNLIFADTKMMPDFDSLISIQNNYAQISWIDLKNFKDFVYQQKLLYKK
jgi:hypothetical protein